MESNDKVQKKISHIVGWIKNYADDNSLKTLVIGVSGGVDSACVSTLCAMTGLKTVAVRLPIRQIESQDEMSRKHCEWLTGNFSNVEVLKKDLTPVLDSFEKCLNDSEMTSLSLANTRSRIRMTMLYQIASTRKGIVVGTGNKVEDFGVGFFTKYGDGGVDISPIADLMKSEVRELCSALGVLAEIVDAPPTDGLWDDGRTDEDQIGLSYDQLEWAMEESKRPTRALTDEEQAVIKRYLEVRGPNLHKMIPIPICKIK